MAKTPDASPIGSDYKEAPTSKILTHEETPISIRDLMQQVREHAKDVAMQDWNTVATYFDKITNGMDHTGNDYLSMMGTHITYFSAAWIILMKKVIADRDQTGVRLCDMIDPILVGIKKVVESYK